MARKMKDSEVEWIDTIPEEWKIERLKTNFRFGKGLPITKENLQEKGIPVISYGQIHSKSNTGVTISNDLIRYVSEDYLLTNRNSLVNKNDFIIADTSEDLKGCGNCIYVNDNIQLFAGYHTIILKALYPQNSKYLAYLFKTDNWRSQIRSRVTGIKLFSITQKILKETSIILPPCEEQQKISSFLDEKVTEIDNAIAKTKETIEDYKKYKQSVITEAVTKGLNPDVEMKKTDSEWIGEIPVHWDYIRIQKLFETIDERNDNPNECLLSLYTAIGVKPRDQLEEKGNKAVTVINYKKVKKNDIIVNKLLAWMGAIGYSDYNGVTSPDYDVYRAKINANVVRSYYNNYFRYTCFKGDCYKYGHGIMLMRWRTYPYEFLRIKVPNPPYEEQQEIAEYLDKKCTEIDNLISSKEAIISELEAYKKSLIYEYVTGKKEVK